MQQFRLNDVIITGSEEENALVNAMSTDPLFCMLHCKANVRHHLTSIGVPQAVKECVLSLLFGCDGIAEAGDEQQLDHRIALVLQYVRHNNVDELLLYYGGVSSLLSLLYLSYYYIMVGSALS